MNIYLSNSFQPKMNNIFSTLGGLFSKTKTNNKENNRLKVHLGEAKKIAPILKLEEMKKFSRRRMLVQNLTF